MSKLIKTLKIEFAISIYGLCLIGYSLFIYFNSSGLTYSAGPSVIEVRILILTRIVVGLFFTFAVIFILKSKKFTSQHLIAVFLIGFFSRLLLVPTDPILEDDFNRYLWDGAVTANGINPYKYPPEWFIGQDSVKEGVPYELYSLAESSGDIIEKVNHPHIRTIYPPVAQLVFSIAYVVKPWSVSHYKFLLLIADLIVFMLLLSVLRKLILPLSLISVYWLNPILLHEIFNAGHMDLLMYPFIVAGILYFTSDSFVKSVSYFSIAAGVKIWPVIFIPFILKKAAKHRRVLIFAVFSSFVILCILLLPVIVTKLDDSLGFIKYAKNWSNNDSVFQIINLFIKEIIEIFDFSYKCSHCIARWVITLIFLSLFIYLLKGKEKTNLEMISKFYILIAVMYFISPTQFPWYYTWILPLLALNPRLSFVLYSVFLPLYQFSYAYGYVVWIEHIPIIILFLCELRFKKVREFLMPDRNIEIRINS